MGLSFGWKANDVRESFWIDDPDLVNVSAQARQAWLEDGDASHLRPFIKPGGKPAVITFRPLTLEESRSVQALGIELQDSPYEALTRSYLLAFRIAVDMPEAPIKIAAGQDKETGETIYRERVVRDKGYRLLAKEFVDHLERAHKGIVSFYGRMIWEATFATESEKKASSPPSTTTPSSETGETPPATESPERAA